jgi:hypothetical protein
MAVQRRLTHEWEIHEIDMAVPLSPDEVLLKGTLYCTINRKKDRVMFSRERFERILGKELKIEIRKLPNSTMHWAFKNTKLLGLLNDLTINYQ